MESRPRRIALTSPFLAALLAWTILGAGGPARVQAQTPAPGQARPPGRTEGPRPADRAGSGAKPASEQAKAKVKAKEAEAAKAKARAQAPRREPSKEYQESIRKTVERRRQRRARRAQAQGLDGMRPVGAIVPWPMPPALIVRQTAGVHDEVGSLLDVLRRAR